MKEQFKKIFRRVLKISIIILIVVIIFLGVAFFYNGYYAHKVYHGVYLNGQNLGSWSYSDVYNFLEEKSKYLNQNGLEYRFNEKTVKVQTKLETLDDPDLSRELIRFYNTDTARAVFEEGRDSNFIKNVLNQIILIIRPVQFSWQYDFHEEEWQNILENNFSEYEVSFIPPRVVFEDNEIKIKDSVDGQEFDYDRIMEITKNKIDSFDFSITELELNDIKSPITKLEAESQKDLIQKVVDLKEIILNYEDKFWKINSQIYRDWLILKKDDENNVVLGFDLEKYQKYIQDNIAIYLDQEAQNAKFEVKNGKVVEFQGSHDGLSLNLGSTLEIIEDALNNLTNQDQLDDSINIEMAVDVVKSDVSTQNVNDKGIREIIGTGESDFRGSPKNRVHNIETGAKKLNGMLIAPGEEFATMENLTPIDAESGYLPELVIKGNKTIPEYGGGLCQIGTTIYRAALQSGLKITQRRSHSYRVYYYEPAGMDATIYDPWPDMKFVNDTDKYILIQTRIVGTKLYFDFWGTKDGRQVTVTDPVIYNIVAPGPTKEIETLDLEPGVRKCTESAHNGADAYFDYKVEYVDDRETYEERVRSHYVPWQAVCLIGVEKTASSTEELVGE